MILLLTILAGFGLLYFGGEYLVRGAVGLAQKLGLSELFIGVTLIGFGTSAPELVTSLRAIQVDAVGIAVGNVIGSNVANILLVLGIGAIMHPIITKPKALMFDGSVLIFATAGFTLLLWIDGFTRLAGLLMVGGLIAYLIISFMLDNAKRTATTHTKNYDSEEVTPSEAAEAIAGSANDSLWLSSIMALGGIIGVILGAEWLVHGGSELARLMGVSDTAIGLSVVAIGTSLPELAAIIAASLNKRSDVAIGGIIGSNIFNILCIMGISAIVHPFSILQDANHNVVDIALALHVAPLTSIVSWAHIGALFLSLFMLVLFAITGKRLARWEGCVMVFAYGVYMLLVFDLMPSISFFALL